MAMEGVSVKGLGLSSSIYAHQPKSGHEKIERRPGDWDCAACGFMNWQRRAACLRCSAPPGPSVISSKVNTRETSDEPDYTYVRSHPYTSYPIGSDDPAETEQKPISKHIPQQRPENERHIPPTTQGMESESPGNTYTQHITNERYNDKLHLGESGLSTSRWAPRNSSSDHQSFDIREVWTRVCFCDLRVASADAASPDRVHETA